MSIENRTVFKMVALRGSIKGLTIDPNEYLEDGTPLLKMLSRFEFKPAMPTEEVKRSIQNHHHLNEAALLSLALQAASDRIKAIEDSESDDLSLKALQAITFEFNNATWSLSSFGESELFQNEYSEVLDSWISIVLLDENTSLLPQHIRLLRVGAICKKLSVLSKSTDSPDEVIQLLDALVVFPRDWRQSRFDRSKVDAKFHERQKIIAGLPALVLDENIEKRRRDLEDFTDKAKLRESLKNKAKKIYWEFKNYPDSLDRADDVGVVANRVNTPAVALNSHYFTRLSSALTQSENTELTEIRTANMRPGAMNKINDFVGHIEAEVMWTSASNACADIQVWEDEKEALVPKPSITGLGNDYAAIRSVGWGDLTIVREKLVGYDAAEIAHIENVLPGERRFRENEKTYTSETIVETQTESEQESIDELETTDRQELQVQAKKTIETDFSLSAGVNTSGRYGITKVDTSLSADFKRSKNESRNSSTNLAKEVVSKAVERTFESVRELRRSTITQQMRELNRHEIDNAQKEGGAAPVSHSGVYLWVEKIKELQLFHYGTRLMVEFHIPEPALSLLEQRTLKPEHNIRKPAAFSIAPSFVTPATYQCLGTKYGAEGLEPPPAPWVSTGKGWNSMPDESADGNKAEDVETLELKIPDGYYPFDGFVGVSIQSKNEALGTPQTSKIFFSLAVGGIMQPVQYPSLSDNDGAGEELTDAEQAIENKKPINNSYEILFDNDYTWPDSSVPVNFRAHGHFDKTMYVQITVNCKRTSEFYTEWQLRTWETIKSAHQVLVSNYEQEMRELEFAADELFQSRGLPEKENRRVEREELQKWAIKIMRNDSFKFNAVEAIAGKAEISALAANDQAEIIQFFEETFEWNYMSYILYPYFWGRRDAWDARMKTSDPDSRHLEFLKSGSCRVIVPITPGHEEQFLRYRDQSTDVEEIDRIRATVNNENSGSDYPVDTEFEDLWLELLLNKKEDLVRGSGTLKLTIDSPEVTINMDGEHGWTLTERDVGREIYILGQTYIIESVISADKFGMDTAYKGLSNDAVTYAVGSVPYSAPWLVKLPTSHLILSEQGDKLNG